MATVKRKYSDDEREDAVLAVMANGGNIPLTAKQLDIPDRTLRHWVNQTNHAEAATIALTKKGAAVDALDHIAGLLLGLVVERFGEMSPSQAMVAYGIATDKKLLLSGQPTVISKETSGPAVGRLEGATDEQLAAIESILANSGRGGDSTGKEEHPEVRAAGDADLRDGKASPDIIPFPQSAG